MSGPYKAAQLALLRDVLGAERYPVSTAIRHTTVQATQLFGLAAGGILSAMSPQACLGIDAVSFAASALLVRYFVRSRAVPESKAEKQSVTAGITVVWTHRRRRAVFLTSVLGLFYIAPTALTVPYVAQLGYGPTMVGVVFASDVAGGVVGLLLFSRFVPAGRRPAVLPPACVVAGIPLVFVPACNGIYAALLLFAVTGALWSIQTVVAVSLLTELLPDSHRTQGMAVTWSINVLATGLGAGLAGLAGQVTTPTVAIALAGGTSVLFALWPTTLWVMSAGGGTHRARPQQSHRGRARLDTTPSASSPPTRTGRRRRQQIRAKA